MTETPKASHRAVMARRSPPVASTRIPPTTGNQINKDSRCSLKRFINLSYQEADTFSLTSKEFITSLFPEGEIYISLMPAEARNLIGAVSPDAVPALRMLERLGFEQVDEVDPFDGGPYLTARRDSIPLVASTAMVELTGHADCEGTTGFISLRKEDEFRCIRSAYELTGGRLTLPAAAAETLLLGRQAIRAIMRDPLLPERLCPSDALAALIAAMTRYDRLGKRIWARYLEG